MSSIQIVGREAVRDRGDTEPLCQGLAEARRRGGGEERVDLAQVEPVGLDELAGVASAQSSARAG